MQSTQSLPLETWAQALSQARIEQGLDIGSLARELMLSMAQIRGIEAGETGAFHAQNYYLRGVQRYAERLHITLDPDPGSFQASDAASLRNRAPQRAQGIVQRQSSPANALQLPSERSHGGRLGRWLVILVIILVGAGVYLSIGEGWPSRPVQDMLADNASDNDVRPSEAPSSATNTTSSSPATPVSVATVNMPANTSTNASDTSAFEQRSQTQSRNGQPAVMAEQAAGQASPTSTAADTPANQSAGTTTTIKDTTVENLPAISAENPQATEQDLIQDSATPDEIVLRFIDECWVELRRTDGSSEQGIFNSGDEIRVSAKSVDRLVLGNAAAVQATWSGEAFDMTQFTRGGSVARISGQALLQNAP